ncbi:MAG: DUF4173 domain-containing protein [Clostridiales bacterium]|jgi:hypothetical protein|nr:DUF4173 domain-containing protein [Clostridiales bacterium]
MSNQTRGSQEAPALTNGSAFDSASINYADTGGKAFFITGSALAMAILYSNCFTGINVLPCLSSTIFIFASMAVSAFALKRLDMLKDASGFKWFIPAAILALMNGTLSYSLFNYANIAVSYVLVTFALTKASGRKMLPFSASFVRELCEFAVSGLTESIPFLKKASKHFSSSKTKSLGKILVAVLASFPILLFIGMLLMSADSVFSYYIKRLFSEVSQGRLFPHIIAISIAFMLFCGYLRHLTLIKDRANPSIPIAKADTLMAGTFLTLLNLLFAAFCLIQVAFLFTGGYRQLPEGIVYSEYARSGFFQLLFVTIINFGVLVIFMTIINGGQTGKWITRLLILLSLFTAILIASSFYRMSLYMDAYHFTSLRMLVITFLCMESALIIITLSYLLLRQKGKGFDFIQLGGATCLAFFIIANITGSECLSDALNIRAFYAQRDKTIFASSYEGRRPSDVIDIYNFSQDSAPMLIKVLQDPAFEGSEYAELRASIMDRLVIWEDSLSRNSYWQNWRYMSKSSRKALEKLS